MEIDSLEAIEALVRHGLGVAIVPQRSGMDQFTSNSKPFCDPQAMRRVVLLSRGRSPKARLVDAIKSALKVCLRIRNEASETLHEVPIFGVMRGKDA